MNDEIVVQLPLLPDAVFCCAESGKQALSQAPKNLHAHWQHPVKLPDCITQSPTTLRILDLIGPLNWGQLPERDLKHDWDIDPYILALELPDDWRKRVQEALLSNKETSDLEKRREDLRGQLRRLNYQFEQGLIEETDVPVYEKKAQRLIREINSITIPDVTHIVEIGEQMISFRKVWEKADIAHRHSILKEMLEAVYVDIDTRQVVGVKPYAEFVSLFRQTKMIEQNWRFVLKNSEAVQDAVIAKRLHVLGGSDGHRGSVRPLNRRCQPKARAKFRRRHA